jgi:GNAT superfamily N-acetyltransferase
MKLNFKNYRIELTPQILEIWNTNQLGERFPLAEAFWHYNTSGQGLNFEASDFSGAFVKDELVGFVLTRRFRDLARNPDMQAYAGLGWVSAIVVAKNWQGKGIGTALLQRAEENLAGVTKIRLGGDVGHFFPGIISDGADSFFRKHGYHISQNLEYDLHCSLEDWQSQPLPTAVINGEYFYTQGQAGEEPAILEFLGRVFPGRWRYKIALDFKEGISPKDITLLKRRDGTIAGFLECRHSKSANPVPTLALEHNRTWGGIGPLGVDSNVRGGGLGLGLVVFATDYLKSLGVSDVVIDWTTLVDFYGKLGYKPYKSYKVAFKELR